MWVFVLVVMTSGISDATSSAISTVGGFKSEKACRAAAVKFLGDDHSGSIGHGADFTKDARCLSLEDQPTDQRPRR